ncbi:hypothetical protein WUBG_17705 [Wuchereria bancrofti]|uniref:Uncharacterized protein n=1 Tax=Wuchereria bancrofti TaxID=6293 RepID=J9E7P2_WUCBA|nr:hypothetical protein WUBG_17705 [Wuchereria bancrofti]
MSQALMEGMVIYRHLSEIQYRKNSIKENQPTYSRKFSSSNDNPQLMIALAVVNVQMSQLRSNFKKHTYASPTRLIMFNSLIATDVNDKLRPEKRALVININKIIRTIACSEKDIQ